jgi:hypothetical protein
MRPKYLGLDATGRRMYKEQQLKPGVLLQMDVRPLVHRNPFLGEKSEQPTMLLEVQRLLAYGGQASVWLVCQREAPGGKVCARPCCARLADAWRGTWHGTLLMPPDHLAAPLELHRLAADCCLQELGTFVMKVAQTGEDVLLYAKDAAFMAGDTLVKRDLAEPHSRQLNQEVRREAVVMRAVATAAAAAAQSPSSGGPAGVAEVAAAGAHHIMSAIADGDVMPLEPGGC